MTRYVYYLNKITGPRINRLDGDIVLKKNDVVQMIVAGLVLDLATETSIVILKDLDKGLNLPIRIDLIETAYIASELGGGDRMSRPMIHDLIHNVIKKSCGCVSGVEISGIKENIYYASIHLSIAGQDLTIDARPSDAIAIALKSKSPIFVATSVLETITFLLKGRDNKEFNLSSLPKQRWGEILERMSAEDFKYMV